MVFCHIVVLGTVSNTCAGLVGVVFTGCTSCYAFLLWRALMCTSVLSAYVFARATLCVTERSSSTANLKLIFKVLNLNVLVLGLASTTLRHCTLISTLQLLRFITFSCSLMRWFVVRFSWKLLLQE